MARPRTEFTESDDTLLMRYIARRNPGMFGRQGNRIYQELEDETKQRWEWAKRHPWQSWRERYKKHQDYFDDRIKRYQNRHGITPKLTISQASAKMKKAVVKRIAVDENPKEDGNISSGSDVSENRKKQKRKRTQSSSDGRKKAKREEEEDSSQNEVAVPIPSGSRRKGSDEAGKETEENRRPAGSNDHSVGVFTGEDVELQEAYAGEAEYMSADNEEVGGNGYIDVSPRAQRPVPPKTVTSASAVASISRQAIASSNTVNDSGPLYPDLSDILRQNGKGNSPSQLQHVPGAFEPSVKPKPPSKSAVAGEGSSIRDSHQSQEPTPPLSNVDLQYPRSDNLSTTPEIAPARMPVFPTGNHQNNLRARTDTLVLNDSPTSANNDQATISKLRRRRLFGNAEEDFFESIPSTPRKSRTVRVPREPPQLIEGPFGSLLTDGRPLVRLGWKETVHERVNSDKSDEDGSNEGEGDKSNEPEWPPRRSSQKLNVATSKVESKNNKPAGILPSTKAPSTTALSTSGTPRHTHIESANGGQPGSVSTRQGTLATSSRVNHDPLHLPTRPQHTGESSLLPMQPTKTVQKLFDGLSRRITAALPNVQVADSNTGALQVSFTGQAIGSSAGELSSNVTRHLSPDSPGGLDGDYTFPWRPESGSDPFLVSAAPRGKHNSLGKEKVDVLFTDRDRRKTFGGFDPSPNVPDIDLSVVMKRPYHRLIRPNRQSLPAPGPSATTQAAASFRRVSAPVRNPSILNSSSSSASVMSTADQNMALRLGTDLIFRRMAENHGFHEDTVRRIYAEVGGFERADAVLNDMREAAEAAGRKSIILDPVDVPAHTSPLRRDSDRPSGLQFTPAPITSDDRSDYSPPEASRAGQYARLVRQGRRQEALKREARAVSLGGHSDFLRKIRMSEGVSFRATSTRSSQSPLALMKDARATAAEVAPPPPPESHWGEKEDHLLQSADETVLRELESRMGKVALRRRIQDSLHTLVRNYT